MCGIFPISCMHIQACMHASHIVHAFVTVCALHICQAAAEALLDLAESLGAPALAQLLGDTPALRELLTAPAADALPEVGCSFTPFPAPLLPAAPRFHPYIYIIDV